MVLGLSDNSDDLYDEDSRKKKLMPNPFGGATNFQTSPSHQNHLNKTNRLNNELMIGNNHNHNYIANENDYANYDEDELDAERTAYCPLIESAEKRCRKVEIMNGDVYGELLQPCGVHQICYLCVSFEYMFTKILIALQFFILKTPGFQTINM